MKEAGDEGGGALWVVAFMAVVWVSAVAALAVGGVRVARHRADAAADLAALAAAARVAEGAGEACRSAAVVVREFGGRLKRCQVRGSIVDVSVTIAVTGALAIGDIRIVSRARGGPAESESVPLPHLTR
ncbi:Rv3654c family TadE-like protein [Actinomadura sp. NPDC047616]|uniref:Rv3654c family TadE-like protein n=1 Tax=Actinomadura sp. NPDC047616 TaxID=3155914 RepID=UPI0034092D1A